MTAIKLLSYKEQKSKTKKSNTKLAYVLYGSTKTW